jgi:hypothetical protein
MVFNKRLNFEWQWKKPQARTFQPWNTFALENSSVADPQIFLSDPEPQSRDPHVREWIHVANYVRIRIRVLPGRFCAQCPNTVGSK